MIKRYGHDVLIDAMALVIKELPHARLEILGRGQAVPDLQAQVERLGLGDYVTFQASCPMLCWLSGSWLRTSAR